MRFSKPGQASSSQSAREIDLLSVCLSISHHKACVYTKKRSQAGAAAAAATLSLASLSGSGPGLESVCELVCIEGRESRAGWPRGIKAGGQAGGALVVWWDNEAWWGMPCGPSRSPPCGTRRQRARGRRTWQQTGQDELIVPVWC